VSGGEQHSLALTAGGAVLAWGGNGAGQLGLPDPTQSPTPAQGRGLADHVAALAAGNAHSVALMDGGQVLAWGENGSGELGRGGEGGKYALPAQVSGLGSGVRSINARQSHTLAVKDDGSLVT